MRTCIGDGHWHTYTRGVRRNSTRNCTRYGPVSLLATLRSRRSRTGKPLAKAVPARSRLPIEMRPPWALNSFSLVTIVEIIRTTLTKGSIWTCSPFVEEEKI